MFCDPTLGPKLRDGQDDVDTVQASEPSLCLNGKAKKEFTLEELIQVRSTLSRKVEDFEARDAKEYQEFQELAHARDSITVLINAHSSFALANSTEGAVDFAHSLSQVFSRVSGRDRCPLNL